MENQRLGDKTAERKNKNLHTFVVQPERARGSSVSRASLKASVRELGMLAFGAMQCIHS